jgi:hypothetical protein
VKHFESRDPKDGEKNELEVLLELELDSAQRANETMLAIQRAGFQVRELTRTLAPKGLCLCQNKLKISKN